MFRILCLATLFFLSVTALLLCEVVESEASYVRAHSAILIDAAGGQVLYEQDADSPIPPASVTKILTLYLVFDAIKQGHVHPSDLVKISPRAAKTGGSRMGLRAGKEVQLEELIKGVAVVSGNDAAVAVAEHLCGDVESFVSKMNAKARELGMTNSEFMTPNGLPAKGQVSTARDLAKLSLSYIRHYPEALQTHSMTSYTYGKSSHHNANRLLGTCPGVDGIKTGFVCASGFNLSATARRGDVRLIAVVMGARSAWVRTVETEKLLEAGFQKTGSDSINNESVEEILARRQTPGSDRDSRLAGAAPVALGGRSAPGLKRSKAKGGSTSAQAKQTTYRASSGKNTRSEKRVAIAEDSCPVTIPSKTGAGGSKQKALVAKQPVSQKKVGRGEKSEGSDTHTESRKSSTATAVLPAKKGSYSKTQKGQEKSSAAVSQPASSTRQKPVAEPQKKNDKKSAS